MGRFSLFFFSALFCILVTSRVYAEYRVKDSLGTEIVLESTPWRVVTMTPALAEIASAIGLQSTNIVGVSEYTDFPAELKGKPSIGPYSKPNLEKIVGLKPDLVLASEDGTPHELIARLRKIMIPVMVIKTEGLDSVEASYRLLGSAFGQEFQSKLALDSLHEKIFSLKARATAREKDRARKLSVVIQVGEDPLIVAGGKNFLSEGLNILGVINTYFDAKTAYPRVSVEDVLKKNPDFILIIALGNDSAVFERAKKRWSSFSTLTAVREKHIFIVRSDALVRPGPRFPDGIGELEAVMFSKKGLPR